MEVKVFTKGKSKILTNTQNIESTWIIKRLDASQRLGVSKILDASIKWQRKLVSTNSETKKDYSGRRECKSETNIQTLGI